MTVSIHLPDRLIVVHTEPDRNTNLGTREAGEALTAIELAGQVLRERIARQGGESPAPSPGIRWRIPETESPSGL